jgi:hypothetical protein
VGTTMIFNYISSNPDVNLKTVSFTTKKGETLGNKTARKYDRHVVLTPKVTKLGDLK